MIDSSYVAECWVINSVFLMMLPFPVIFYPCPINNPQYLSAHNGRCYYFEVNGRSKPNAASNCVNIKGKLWEPKKIDFPEIMNQIHCKAMTFSQVHNWWIGVSDLNTEGTVYNIY